MKKLLLLILPLLAITFNSCSKDDDGETGGGNTKLIKKIVYGYEESEDDYSSYEFTYDNQQRLTKITETNYNSFPERRFTDIAYSNNKVTATTTNSIYDWRSTTTFTLDNNGYVTRADNGVEEVTFEYSNGVLTKSTRNDNRYIALYTWVNGNLTKAEEKYTGGGGSYIGTETRTYTYGNVENKMNIDPFYNYFHGTEFLLFKGTKIKNLPTSLTYYYYERTDTDTNTRTDTSTLTYTFDDDGYPTKIIANGSQIAMITYY